MAAVIYIFVAFATISFFVYRYLSNIYSHWKNKGIKGPKPKLIFGNVKALFEKKQHMFDLIDDIYRKYPDEKVVGVYIALTPALIARDPEIVRTVLTKDYQIFKERGFRIGNKPISNSLFLAAAEVGKVIRQRLTPIFTTGKLKSMMGVYSSIAEEFYQYIDTSVLNNGPVELWRLILKYNTKAVSLLFLGIEVNTFTEEVSEIQERALSLFSENLITSGIGLILNNCSPELVSFLGFDSTPPKITDYFLKLVKEMLKRRENETEAKKDFMDYIIAIKKQGTLKVETESGVEELECTDELLTAQVMNFLAGAFDVPSGSTATLLYELAKNPEIYDRCLKEIDGVIEKSNGKLDYDALRQLEYTSRAFDENLRLHSGAVLFRQCVRDYTFEGLDLTIKKGTKIFLPMNSLHHDAKYFPEPEKFDPDRFLPENKHKIHNYYKPFGDGPRNCMGLRFGQLQALSIVAHLLHRYQITVCDRTPEKIVFDPRSINLQIMDGIWVNIEKRQRD